MHTIGQAGQNHNMNRGGSCQCGSAGIPSVSARALSGVSAFTLSVWQTIESKCTFKLRLLDHRLALERQW